MEFFGNFQRITAAQSPKIFRGLLYSLGIFSTFSIAGSDGSIGLLYILCLFNLLANRAFWKVPQALWGAFLVFIVCVWLSGIFSPYEQGGGVALVYTWRLYLPFVLFLVWPHVDLQRWFQVFSIFLFIIAIYGIIQFFTGADWFRSAERSLATPYRLSDLGEPLIFHAKGNFTHHLTYGGYLLLVFPSLVMLAFCGNLSLSKRRWFGVVAVAMLCAIFLSLGRSIWMGSALAVFVLSFRFSRKIPLFLGIAGGIFFTLMVATYTDKSVEPAETPAGLVWQRLASSFMLTHNQDRLLMWESGWDAIQDHMFFGIGPRNNAEALPKYRESISQRTGHQFFNSASAGVHNIYLQIWLYSGIFGLLSYLFIWLLVFYQTGANLLHVKNWGLHSSLLLGGLAGLSGFLVAGIFENNFLDAEVQIAVMLVLSLNLYCQAQLRSS